MIENRLILVQKIGYGFGGYPPPPLYGFPPENFSSKRAKNCVFAQKTPDFGPKNRLRIWGVPPPPLYGFLPEKFSSKRAKNGVFLLKKKTPDFGQKK